MTVKHEHPARPDSLQLDLWGVPQQPKWEDFQKAREYARSLDLQDKKEWEILWRKRDIVKPGIPGNPDEIYKDKGWKGWDDWLGTDDKNAADEVNSGITDIPGTRTLWDTLHESRWLPFVKAREQAWKLGFEYQDEWRLYIEGKFPGREPLPDNIPLNPDRIYRFVGWKNWKDWLVPPEKRIEYTSFYKARDFVRSLRIKSKDSWRDHLRDHVALLEEYEMLLPERPHLEYQGKGWEGWEDWLGLQVKYQDFAITRKFVHSLKLSNMNDWRRYCSGQLTGKPVRKDIIFAYPEIAFKDEGWKSWEDWLGESSVTVEKPETGIPTGAVECRCRGKIKDCEECNGRGYYYVVK